MARGDHAARTHARRDALIRQTVGSAKSRYFSRGHEIRARFRVRHGRTGIKLQKGRGPRRGSFSSRVWSSPLPRPRRGLIRTTRARETRSFLCEPIGFRHSRNVRRSVRRARSRFTATKWNNRRRGSNDRTRWYWQSYVLRLLTLRLLLCRYDIQIENSN